jgi:hypothetical protein
LVVPSTVSRSVPGSPLIIIPPFLNPKDGIPSSKKVKLSISKVVI